ncbi:MAG TPA: septal ring lytic transglycosylase RlpA family protein [Thermoanaerobaculia bacterium]
MRVRLDGRRSRVAPPEASALFRFLCLLTVAFAFYGCRTAGPPSLPERFSGMASWYGEEFAGRTTANGEIFDPSLLTAAHRTLPFGTVLDVSNPVTQQTVRVRVNDRGPYIANRILDLSYAAARQIGLIEPGVGTVDIRIARIGSGDREPPAPFDVAITPAPPAAPAAGEPPPISFPLPGGRTADATVDRVDVEVQRGGVMTRRQVSADGTTIEEVPVEEPRSVGVSPAPLPAVRPAARPARSMQARIYVQVGAFSVEANARALQDRITALGQQAHVDHSDLYRVRIGPFANREEAVRSRAQLEANGISAIIVTE